MQKLKKYINRVSAIVFLQNNLLFASIVRIRALITSI